MGVSHGIEFAPEVIAAAMVRIYRREFDIDRELEAHIYAATRDIFRRAVAVGLADAVGRGTPMPDEAFRDALLHNVEVFSAFRTHRMQKDIAAMMLDREGKLKPFARFARDVQPYVDHKNKAWLRTEYDTAVHRAQLAAEWQQFEAERDIFPNLRWVESVSPDPGADHRVFWNTVRPVGDRFWSRHRPGDRWNCKCDLEPTDEPPTAVPSASGKRDDPAPGLDANPGKDGEIFSRRHPYYPQSCSTCPYARNRLSALWADLVDRKDCNECAGMERSIRSAERHYCMEQMQPLLDKKVIKKVGGKEIAVGFTKYGNKHLFSDTFGRSSVLTKEDLASLDKVLHDAEFIGSSPLTHPRTDGIDHFFYYESKIRGQKVRLNVAKQAYKGKDGRISTKYFLYSINDI